MCERGRKEGKEFYFSIYNCLSWFSGVDIAPLLEGILQLRTPKIAHVVHV